MSKVQGKATVRPVAHTRMPVAIVGFGKSRELVHTLPPDVPVWSLSDAPIYDFPRLDMVFEMHPERDLVLEGERYERLKTQLPYPVMMLERDTERYPSSYRYPIEAAIDAVFENIKLGKEITRYFDSSMPYMLALAVMSGYRRVYLYGFELRSDTEYRYQRIGAALLIGWAAGKGVEIILPPDSALLPPTLYGYDNFQHITRQDLGELHRELMVWHGEYVEDLENASTIDAVGLWTKRLSQAEGGLYVVKNLVDICNKKKTSSNGDDPDDAFTISRQNLEQYLHDIHNQESDWMGKLNMIHARIVERASNGVTVTAEDKAQREEAFREMYKRAGAIHVLKHLIEKLDRAQVILLPFDDPFHLYEEGEKDGIVN